MSDVPAFFPQAERFLTLMRNMEPAAQRAFLTIYELAPHSAGSPSIRLKGDHVRLAMVEALLNPGVAYWVRLNLAVRVARKLAQTTGNSARLEKLDETLEAFHVAADAFALRMPLAMALTQRQPKANVTLTPVRPLLEGVTGISGEEVALIRTFKNRIIPGLVRAIRRDISRTA